MVPQQTIPASYKKAVVKDGAVSLISTNTQGEFSGNDALIIKPSVMGICRADVKEVTNFRDIPGDRGPLFRHELVGEIINTGSGTQFKKGDKVTFNPNITPQRTTGFAELFFIKGTREELD